MSAGPRLGFPEKYELAHRYATEGTLETDSHEKLEDADRLVLWALNQQATFGPCNEPSPSMWDYVAKAKWRTWKELGNRSKMEAMVLYAQAIEKISPDWWKWKPLGLELEDTVDVAAPAGPHATRASAPAVDASTSVLTLQAELEALNLAVQLRAHAWVAQRGFPGGSNPTNSGARAGKARAGPRPPSPISQPLPAVLPKVSVSNYSQSQTTAGWGWVCGLPEW